MLQPPCFVGHAPDGPRYGRRSWRARKQPRHEGSKSKSYSSATRDPWMPCMALARIREKRPYKRWTNAVAGRMAAREEAPLATSDVGTSLPWKLPSHAMGSCDVLPSLSAMIPVMYVYRDSCTQLLHGEVLYIQKTVHPPAPHRVYSASLIITTLLPTPPQPLVLRAPDPSRPLRLIRIVNIPATPLMTACRLF